MNPNIEGCKFYHPEYGDKSCHIALAFADEYVDENCTYFQCSQIEDCYYKQLHKALYKLKKIESLCNDCKSQDNSEGMCATCSRADECYIEDLEIPTYNIAEPILGIINEKEVEDDE